jgi:hypothetical protein
MNPAIGTLSVELTKRTSRPMLLCAKLISTLNTASNVDVHRESVLQLFPPSKHKNGHLWLVLGWSVDDEFVVKVVANIRKTVKGKSY